MTPIRRLILAVAAAAAILPAACRRSSVGQDVPLDRTLHIEVQNPLDLARPGVNVVVALADIASIAKDFSASCLTLYDGSTEIPYQVDDIDQDSVPDLLVFQTGLMPKQLKRLDLYYNIGRSLLIRYPPRAHAAVSPELGGPAWESDGIAYRLLLDGRNAIGVFAKPEPGIAIERFAKSPDAGRIAQPWGADVCLLGETLGCGGFGFLKEGRVVRPREAARTKDQPALRRFAQVLADGPVRAIVRITYDGWVVDGAPRAVRATHTIWAGRRWATCDLDVGPGWRPPVTVGLAGSKEHPLVRKKDFCYTFGAQSLPMSDTAKPDTLGLALIFKQEHFASFLDEARAEDVEEGDSGFSRAVILTPDAEGRLKWAYMAAWGRGKLGIRDAAEFEGLCEASLRDLGAPIVCHIKSR
jgi:hypothetical protein